MTEIAITIIFGTLGHVLAAAQVCFALLGFRAQRERI
jgi:hypothetical protein